MFREHYDVLAPVCRRRPLGLLIAAVDASRRTLVAMRHLRARPTHPDVAIVGRHPNARVILDDSRASLRHLLVVVEPPDPGERHPEVRFRVIDLRTGSGFGCEYGLQLESVTATGPVVVRCADYILMMLPTGDPTDWPDDAGDAWELVPPRIFLDERTWGDADRATPLPIYPAAPAAARRTTQMIALHGPALLSDPVLVEASDPLRGVLNMRQGSDVVRYKITDDMLSRGVLIGRYDRCDTGHWLRQPLVSRVHAMVLDIGDATYLIDLASTNGVEATPGDDRSRVVLAPVWSSHAFGIGGAGVTLSWTRSALDCGSYTPKPLRDSSTSQH